MVGRGGSGESCTGNALRVLGGCHLQHVAATFATESLLPLSGILRVSGTMCDSHDRHNAINAPHHGQFNAQIHCFVSAKMTLACAVLYNSFIRRRPRRHTISTNSVATCTTELVLRRHLTELCPHHMMNVTPQSSSLCCYRNNIDHIA
jgi:hypothetical protein